MIEGSVARFAQGDSDSDSTRVVHRVGDLAAIFDPEVNVVVLRRPVRQELAEEVRGALHDRSLRVFAAVALDAIDRGELSDVLASFPALARDIQAWVKVLADLTGCERVGVRLARVDAAMCPRLHVDRVTLRVVCTYHGAGTEYVRSADLDRRWLGHAAHGVPDEASGLLCASAQVRAASAGDIVVLKGEAWPGNANRGAVHRSPAASAAAPRLVLTLDAI